MSILHIKTSARISASNSRAIGQYLVDALGPQAVVSRDLAQQPLPAISAEDLCAVHSSTADSRSSLQQQLKLSNQLIEELKAAETLIIEAPVYNFGVPVVLKQWIDLVCRAGVSFHYTDQGPVGLLGVKQAFIVSASGGTAIGSEIDFSSPYLEHICRFIGVEDIYHIQASGSKGKPDEIVAAAKHSIDELLSADRLTDEIGAE